MCEKNKSASEQICESCENRKDLCDKHQKQFLSRERFKVLHNIADTDKLESLNDFYEARWGEKIFTSAIAELWSEIKENQRYIPNSFLQMNNNEVDLNVSIKHYTAIYGIMFLICTAGCALGIFSASLFRKAKNATLFLVVLFVVFLLFSRLFLIANGTANCLVPLQILWENIPIGLEYGQWGCYIPLVLSLFSMSRYITNLICLIPYCSYREFYLIELSVFVIVFCILPLVVAWLCVANKRKNWKDLSR